jgi:sugar phosphate permease
LIGNSRTPDDDPDTAPGTTLDLAKAARLGCGRVRPPAWSGPPPTARQLPINHLAARSRYRWAILAAGFSAQTAFAAVGLGLPVIAPAIRDELSLSLGQVGIVLGAGWIGTILTLLPWGLAVDRVGERWTLTAGMSLCAGALAGAAFVRSLAPLVVLLGVSGAAGGSVQSGSGRAIMNWFDRDERGLALGIRQTAVPVGGIVGALALPTVVAGGGLRGAFLLLAGMSALGAVLGALLLRERVREQIVEAVPWTLRDRRLWLVCWGSGLYLVAQVAVLGFLVLYLHDERGFSISRAAAVLAGINVLGAAFRIGGGRWSDVLGSRIRPLRWVGLALTAAMALSAAATAAPIAVAVTAFLVAGGLSMAWNGLSFTAAAELAGEARSGAAIGFQQTVLSVVGAAVPPGFAVLVETTSWRTAFAVAAVIPLAGWWALGLLTERPRASP